MSSTNINNYGANKFDLRIDYSNYFDITIGNDENDFDEDVVFSSVIIDEDNGENLPINIDLDSYFCSDKHKILWNDGNLNQLISKNYIPLSADNDCYTAKTICDIGLTGIDNGLLDTMSGRTLFYTMGLDPDNELNPLYFTKKFKLNSVRSFANYPNTRFSGNSETVYNIVSKESEKVGYYNELYGGFYQGFYKLSGYDYEVFPERVNKGWTSEVILKPRQRTEFELSGDDYYLNDVYPENSGIFFFMGARSENKFYHTPSGKTETGFTVNCEGEKIYFGDSDSGYTKDTHLLGECFKTCSCGVTGETINDCIRIYPSTADTATLANSFDPGLDIYSNGLAIRFDGDPVNPKICVKYVSITGDCINNNNCDDIKSYQTGYCINEICSATGIYENCGLKSSSCDLSNTNEQWVMISIVFDRKDYLEDCDLLNFGGLGSIRKYLYQEEIENRYVDLIRPPVTTSGSTGQKFVTDLNAKWLSEKNERSGTLKIYVNGYQFMVIEDFEEIIPRELKCEKEKQVGVPFNFSWGGGTQGLRENLIPMNCQQVKGPYIQDKQLFTNETLSGTSFSSLTTNILSESTFGGTFMGGISQFRMYTKPLTAPQIQHNFRVNKDRYDLYDFWCLECLECLTDCYFDYETSQDINYFDFVINKATCSFDVDIYKDE